MRNILKKAAALCLALCLCLQLTACYSEENTWAAKAGDNVMPIGGYIYYITSAFTDAVNRVPASDQVLKSQIDGQDAQSWIKDRALRYLGAYYYVQDQFDALGLTMSEEDQQAMDTGFASSWAYYKDVFEGIGISEESFKKAYAEYNVKFRMVLLALYGEGGEKALSESELKDYYLENYDAYEYMYVSKSKNDEDGNSIAITDEEHEELLKNLNIYADEVNDGSLTLGEAFTEYSYIAMVTPQHQAPGAVLKSNISATVAEALAEMEDGEAKVIEVDAGCFLLQKLSVSDKFDEAMADEEQRESLLYEIKSQEFSDLALEEGDLAGVELNVKALDSVKIGSIVTNKEQTGASVPPADESSSQPASSTTK